MKKMIILPAVMAGALMLTACGQTAAVPGTVNIQNVETNVVKVESREQVNVEPDIAEVVYAVYSQASDAQTCQTQNSTDLDKVIEVLTGQGIEEKNIQTSNYGLNPVYDWEDGKSISGYEMNTEVTVSNISMDQVGTLLSESVDAGINSISSVTYKSSKYDESYREALSKAVESAKAKAAAMEEAGGYKLGKIVNIEEYPGSQTPRANVYSAAAGKTEAVADMAVMPGEIEIEAAITVEFAIE